MDACIQLANTGHLGLTTLHANNAYQALQRVINLYPGDGREQLYMDLSLTLRAIEINVGRTGTLNPYAVLEPVEIGGATVRLATLSTQFNFTPTLAWMNLVQYDNVSEVFGVNSRLQWIPKAGQEAYIVINHNTQDFDKDGSFQSALSDVTLKFTYTFRF